MDTQHKTKKQLQQELLELRQEINSLKTLANNDSAKFNRPEDITRETSSRLEFALQGGNLAWWEMDVSTGNVTFAKRKVEMLGYAPENFKHYKDFTNLVHPQDYERIMNAMRGHLEGEYEHYEAEYRIQSKSGEYIWFYDYGSIVKKDADGKPMIVTGFVYDITDKKKTEERLLFISRAVEATSDAIAIADSNGRHFYQNKAYSDLFGYKSAEETEVAGGVSVVIEDPEIARGIFRNIMNGIPGTGEIEMVTKSGRVFPAFESANAIQDSDGSILGIIVVINDITEYKQNKETLAKSDQMLQMVLDNFPGVVFWKDRHSNYLGCNRSFATGAGLNSPAEIVGKTDLNLPWASTEAINYRKDDFDVMESGKGRLHIVEMQHQSDGQVIWLDTSKFPLRDSLGQVIGVIGVSNDISMLKMAEQELINTNKELAYQNREKEKRAAELVIANKELLYQNDEKEKRATELINAKERAEESDRLKSAFLTNMSHEIRTPMNGILVFAELLKEPNLSSDDQQDFIQTIQISGERMLDTINSIVDISKIESGLMKVDIKETNINEKIEFAYKFFKPEVDIKGLQFLFKNGLPTKEAIIKTDSEKVYGMLINLIKNAIKFTNAGSIEFGYEKRGKYLEFFVKDSGIGIPENQKEMIFERFRQVSESFNRGYEGSGLGLSIAKSYVEMLGGKIWVESEEGKGSIFYFTIPYNPVSEEKTAIKNVTIEKDKEVQLKNLKILIVEDDEVSYSGLTKTLQKISKEVLHAITGVQAVEACRNNPDLDLVLMDIRMPNMDGNEATRQIRQFNKDVIIIAQTAFAFAGDKEKAIEAGCNDYISKPIKSTLLYELIKKHIRDI
jgi:PAS domain S-box-containing protein